MNISYNWLKHLIDIPMSPDELAQRLTSVGLTVEGVHSVDDDFVLDVDLTSNRPDCLSHLGVAREVRAMTGGELKTLKRLETSEIPVPKVLAYDMARIDDADLCHRFTGRIIRGVKVGPSPKVMVKRLEAIGERSINNIADITNYVMHELGQPMHSFDLNKLAEQRIIVRRARPGETIKTLDEVQRKLDETMLAICDAEKPVAIGGIMGGLETGISSETTDVLLEVAYFKRESIRQTSRKLGLATEASYRFERGVDIENLIRASNRATELICELADGTAADLIDVYPTKYVSKEVESKDVSSALERLTSLRVDADRCDRILNGLGIEKTQETIYISPTWRYDIAIEEDLVEEVARHTGYDQIVDELPPAYGAGEYQPNEPREKQLRQKLADVGFDEAISYSFIDTKFDGEFQIIPGLVDRTADEPFVTLQHSVIEGAVRMRPSNLPGLLDAIRLNLNFQRRDLKLFELGKVFGGGSGEDGVPNEREALSLVLTGNEMLQDRMMAARELDFYDAKGAVEAALDSVGVQDAAFSAAEVKHLRNGQAAVVAVNGVDVGYVGRLDEEIASGYKFKQPVFVAEINLEAVLDQPLAPVTYKPLPKFPGISRDISFVADRTVTFNAIRMAIASQNADLCRSIEFVDVYEGKGLGENERSITVRLDYRSDERTLVEDEVDTIHGKIVDSVVSRLGVGLRS
jgi:phenylalanyl-tRNA synthetase beta chain